MKCERYHKKKQCVRKANYVIQTMGYDFQVCWWHKFTNPLSQLWINIQLKYAFWRNDVGSWSLWSDIIRRD